MQYIKHHYSKGTGNKELRHNEQTTTLPIYISYVLRTHTKKMQQEKNPNGTILTGTITIP